jgi:hypothetical protein
MHESGEKRRKLRVVNPNRVFQVSHVWLLIFFVHFSTAIFEFEINEHIRFAFLAFNFANICKQILSKLLNKTRDLK